MVARQGDLYWYDFGHPRGSDPGFRRPVVVVQSNTYNATALATVVVCALTTNPTLALRPGNVALRAGEGGLSRDSVVNVTQVGTVDKGFLDSHIGTLSPHRVRAIHAGLRMALAIDDADDADDAFGGDNS